MEMHKDILYKKEDNETWAEWNNRLPTNEDKLDYIGETIYVKICENDKVMAGKITGMLLELGIDLLLPLLDSNDLLEEKIQEGYEVLRLAEERMMSDEDYKADHSDADEDDNDWEYYKKPVNKATTLTVAEMIGALRQLPPDAKLVMTESGFYSNSEFADIMLPKLYTVKNERFLSDLSTGEQVYIIGHSHQTY